METHSAGFKRRQRDEKAVRADYWARQRANEARLESMIAGRALVNWMRRYDAAKESN